MQENIQRKRLARKKRNEENRQEYREIQQEGKIAVAKVKLKAPMRICR